MKTLKLNHNSALQVREGQKTSTLRIFDEKHISVGDQVELIDKVDPKRPDSWVVFGFAAVDAVIEKRLRDIDHTNIDGHDAYMTRQDMLDDLRRYYGESITEETPVKIISFSFKASEPASQQVLLQTCDEVKVFTDGGSRGNPGPSAIGYVVLDMQDQVIETSGEYIGITTNNQAEYQGLKTGLLRAKACGASTVHVYMDSLLVVNQMKGIFKVKNRDLWPIYEAMKEQVSQFSKVTFQHVPREMNKIADAAVNKTLDAKAEE